MTRASSKESLTDGATRSRATQWRAYPSSAAQAGPRLIQTVRGVGYQLVAPTGDTQGERPYAVTGLRLSRAHRRRAMLLRCGRARRSGIHVAHDRIDLLLPAATADTRSGGARCMWCASDTDECRTKIMGGHGLPDRAVSSRSPSIVSSGSTANGAGSTRHACHSARHARARF